MHTDDHGPGNTPTVEEANRLKVAAGVVAILLGGFGIHKFILGYVGAGILQIIISIVTCGVGAIIPLIEGIIYLTKSDEDFYQTYIVGRRTWF